MGMAMCRAQFVDNELDRVIRDIDRKSPSTTDIDAAVNTVADHWSEMTMVHPFQEGNSRTQRFFFDQMLRNAGWAVDWTQVNAERVHAARYVGAATVDSSYLAQTLRPAVHPADQIAAGTLTATVNTPGHPCISRDLPRHDGVQAFTPPGYAISTARPVQPVNNRHRPERAVDGRTIRLSFLDPFTGEHHTFHSTYTP
ncbi:Fic family protein, partial [Corynebacterium glyciniphilum]|uniref:Fic family protein n=1 Tax=Corynebacterium glyciniphilum TaxID=1404244 RepID=UPI00264C41CF